MTTEHHDTPKLVRAEHKDIWLPMSVLGIVWPNAQRPLRQSRVKSLADIWDFDFLDIIHVLMPYKGVHHICDGQTRVAALLHMRYDPVDTKVPCRIHPYCDEANAARLFVIFNGARRGPTAIENFRSKVSAGFEMQVAINNIVRRVGLTVDPSPANNNVRAVAALEAAYGKQGGAALSRGMQLITDTWSGDADSLISMIILGYAMFCKEHGANGVDWDRLVEQMAKRFGPIQLKGRAGQLAKIVGCTPGAAVKKIMEETYDMGLRTKKRLTNGKDHE